MDWRGWIEPGAVLAGISALAAIVSAWISWRVFLRQKAPGFPTINVTVEPARSSYPEKGRIAGWHEVRLQLINTSPSRWKAERVGIRSPRDARLLPSSAVTGTNRYGEHIVHEDKFDSAKADRNIPLKLEVDPVGTPRRDWGGGDAVVTAFYLALSSSRDTRVSMRLSLVSLDSEHLRTARTIIMTVPADSGTEDD